MATVSHADQHANVNDAVEALEAKVGVNGSAVTSSLDYKVAQQGLVRIATATATSGTTLDINNCFSSTFDNYRVVISRFNVTAGAYGLNLRMKAGATVATTAYYGATIRWDIALNSLNGASQNNLAQLETSIITTAGTEAAGVIDIYSPNLAAYTSFTLQAVDSRAASAYGAIQVAGQLANTSQYTDLRLYIAAGALASLTATVYGYSKD